MSLTGCWALLSLRGSWCLEALECESRDSVCCLTGGMEGGLWEDSSSQIVEVLWKSESKRMVEEVARCPSLSSFFPGPCTKSYSVGGSCLGSQTKMLTQVGRSTFAQLCTSLVFWEVSYFFSHLGNI